MAATPKTAARRSSATPTSEAWFRLASFDVAKPAEENKALVEQAVARVQHQLGQEPVSVQIQPYLGTFFVNASPEFISHVSDQPEVAGPGKSTDGPQPTLIAPVKVRSASLKSASKSVRKPARKRTAG
jgi:hypothetical protein